jgi:hypothetical protein
MATKEFPKKWLDKLDPEYVDGIQAMETEDIKKRILDAEQNIYDIDIAKESDLELEGLRDKIKEAGSPYRDSKNKEAAKIKLCLYTLEGRGVKL